MKSNLIRGLKWGGLAVIGLWLFVLAAVILSYFGLIVFMVAANLMPVAADPWLDLFVGSFGTWWGIFGFALEFLAPGLLLSSLILTVLGVLISLGLNFYGQKDCDSLKNRGWNY